MANHGLVGQSIAGQSFVPEGWGPQTPQASGVQLP